MLLKENEILWVMQSAFYVLPVSELKGWQNLGILYEGYKETF